jgi:hypothetical protein
MASLDLPLFRAVERIGLTRFYYESLNAQNRYLSFSKSVSGHIQHVRDAKGAR